MHEWQIYGRLSGVRDIGVLVGYFSHNYRVAVGSSRRKQKDLFSGNMLRAWIRGREAAWGIARLSTYWCIWRKWSRQ